MEKTLGHLRFESQDKIFVILRSDCLRLQSLESYQEQTIFAPSVYFTVISYQYVS